MQAAEMAVSRNPELLLLSPFSAQPLYSSPRTAHLPSSFSEVRFSAYKSSHAPFMKKTYRKRIRNAVAMASNPLTESFIHTAVTMNFFERLSLAWHILFPSSAAAATRSEASIAKQRLKMILFSDRCAVSDEAKQKIVSKIMDALSDFVEIDSEDKIQLSVSTDVDLGTVYSVMVPVRRVKPGYGDDEYRGITGVEYVDAGDGSGSVDVKFEFYVPGENNSYGM